MSSLLYINSAFRPGFSRQYIVIAIFYNIILKFLTHKIEVFCLIVDSFVWLWQCCSFETLLWRSAVVIVYFSLFHSKYYSLSMDLHCRSIAPRCWTIARWRNPQPIARRDWRTKTQLSSMIDRRTAVVRHRLLALYRPALTITLCFTISDAKSTSSIMNCFRVLLNVVGWLLRDVSMMAPQRDRPTTQIRRQRVTKYIWQ